MERSRTLKNYPEKEREAAKRERHWCKERENEESDIKRWGENEKKGKGERTPLFYCHYFTEILHPGLNVMSKGEA